MHTDLQHRIITQVLICTKQQILETRSVYNSRYILDITKLQNWGLVLNK